MSAPVYVPELSVPELSVRVPLDASRGTVPDDFLRLIYDISKIDRDAEMKRIATSNGLNIYKVGWLDVGRGTPGSVYNPFGTSSTPYVSYLGDNITDSYFVVTDADGREHHMPQIKSSNIVDLTFDVPIGAFNVTVGNETSVGGKTSRIPFMEYLERIPEFTGIHVEPMYIPRDEVILTSPLASILPCHDGKTEFAIEFRNYQANATDPAILAIVVSPLGTSASVLSSRKQTLHFNDHLRAKMFQAERLTVKREREGRAIEGAMDAEERENNVLYVFQIPLLVKKRPTYVSKGIGSSFYVADGCFPLCAAGCPVAAGPPGFDPYATTYRSCGSRGIEDAQLDIGRDVGEFPIIGDRVLRRDMKFPIRCTLMRFKVTDSNIISPAMFEELSSEFRKMASKGIASGSHATGSGDAGRKTVPKCDGSGALHKSWIAAAIPVDPKERETHPLSTLF
jgi:hypothetical protein